MPYKDISKRRECVKKHYQNNKEAYKDRARKHKAAHKIKLREAINKAKNVLCADCGGVFHYVCMDFDHIDPSNKAGNVADAPANGWSLSRTMEEIAKCEVVCANCHRLRTLHRRT